MTQHDDLVAVKTQLAVVENEVKHIGDGLSELKEAVLANNELLRELAAVQVRQQNTDEAVKNQADRIAVLEDKKNYLDGIAKAAAVLFLALQGVVGYIFWEKLEVINKLVDKVAVVELEVRTLKQRLEDPKHGQAPVNPR